MENPGQHRRSSQSAWYLPYHWSPNYRGNAPSVTPAQDREDAPYDENRSNHSIRFIYPHQFFERRNPEPSPSGGRRNSEPSPSVHDADFSSSFEFTMDLDDSTWLQDDVVYPLSYLLGPNVEVEWTDDEEDRTNDEEDWAYEELMRLAENAVVSSGLSEEAIQENLWKQKYISLQVESCCVCQEEYGYGEDVAKLGCQHQFHVECIVEWLLRKNICPLCKSVVVADYH